MSRIPVQYQHAWLKKGDRKSEAFDPSFTWGDIFKSIWMFLEEDKLKFVFFNIILFSVLFYELVPPFIVGRVVDFFTAYHTGDSLQLFYSYIIFLTVSYVCIAVVRLYSKNVLSRIGVVIKSRVKVRGFERLMDASVQWHAKENTGNKVQRILTGSHAFLEFIKIGSGNLYPVFVNFIGAFLFFLFTHWSLFLFLAIYEAIFFIIQFTFNNKLERLSIKHDEALERSSGTLIEGTGNILAIKATGAEAHMHANVAAHEQVVKDFQLAITETNNMKWRFFQFWNGCAYGIFLLLAGRLVLSGGLSIGMIVVLYAYFNKLKESAADVVDLGTALVGFRADFARLMPLFKENSAIQFGSRQFPEDWKMITIADASFHYPNKQVGLAHFNLHIERGARIGIAGISGGGKSTLVKILLGLYKLDSGALTVDRINFYDIAHAAIMKQIAVVLQETELFNLSLEENITMMRDLDPNLLSRAIAVADLKEVIARLPEGLHTKIGERGYSLSGGERQRLGIARAIYKNCPIILLDEATSSLDSQTESHIIDQLFGEFGREKTFIIVAHRLSTLKNADEVIVVEQGMAVEQGTFEELLKKPSSKLSVLYALQNNP